MSGDKVIYVSAADIVGLVCDMTRVSKKCIMAADRRPNVVLARHLAMLIVYELVECYASVGRVFNKDHTTIMNAEKTMSERLKSKRFVKYKKIYDKITTMPIYIDFIGDDLDSEPLDKFDKRLDDTTDAFTERMLKVYSES